ncbi:IucA/IucC family protein [Paenibacillus puerhi]|uniref:IucA/IucC family protein n=1 Tax=Paenibacillus puerhi TaxID=2692622 RepID=UPI001357C8C9|nr:IucA/IucC family protein [Paenibacillus puerhi]
MQGIVAGVPRTGREPGEPEAEAKVGAEANVEAEAREAILADLINALLAEGIWDDLGRGELLAGDRCEAELRAVGMPAGSEAAADREADAQLEAEPGPVPDCRIAIGPGSDRQDGGSADREERLAYRWWLDRERGRAILFPVRRAIVQPYRYVPGGGVYERTEAQPGLLEARPLGAVELLELVAEMRLAQSAADGTSQPAEAAMARLRSLLELTLEQAGWSAACESGDATGPSWTLADLERRAAYRDRPFHPVAKAKGGWGRDEYAAYSAEAGQAIRLVWVAVDRRRLIGGVQAATGSRERPAEPLELLLSDEEREYVQRAMQEKGLSPERYMALPAHPWQLGEILPRMLPAERESGLWIPLEARAGDYRATASSRSLAPLGGGGRHVKLPLGIVALGAVRYLPAVHMMNGDKGQRLLEQAKELDPVLRSRLYLCDESNWWAYMPESGDLFAEPPRHLSALVRIYPEELMEAEDVRLLPMCALAARASGTEDHPLDGWCRARGLPLAAEPSLLMLFGEVCLNFFHMALRLFRLGVLPEIHGQNTILVLKHGRVEGLLLRDHDSVRLHLPWMERHGLEDPRYRMKPGYPNSLYNETPQKLLAYLQTLGIQVNLYAILEILSTRYGIREPMLWTMMAAKLREAGGLAAFTGDELEVVEEAMFRQPVWPWKNIVKPLLEQQGEPTGSMPSGFSAGVNPFRSLGEGRDM